ncbi:hypothetical protein B0H14DRAFT_2626846 [Mycena olivaceomarginata]|nr:hypothetical protein B0H14DRAFT_2626846 [Mycena olivaceomarginata]
MSDGTKKGWGGSRDNSGRKKKAVVASLAPTRIQDTGMRLRISASSPTSSSAQTTRANPAVNGAAGSSASGFFAPRISQQPRVVSNPVPSTVPVDQPSTVAQLNQDLADLALDGPLDTSERVFDESLGDEDGEGDDSENAELVQKETEEAEPKSLSENHQWLKTTLAQIVKDTNGRLKMPRCYKDGQFWVRPRDPVFALKRAAVHGFSPASLYLLPIFVWLPHFLPGRPDSFKCECGASIILNGYNENPIARRITSCSQTATCALRVAGMTRAMARVIREATPGSYGNFPEFVQRAFPACLSAHSALDTGEMDVMKATFAGHFGADLFSKMVRELKVLHHDHLETMYYCAALHFGLRGPQQVPQFSKFDDSLGYAGYAPSRQYFKSMFTAWFSVHCTLIDRVMSSLSAAIIKAGPYIQSILNLLYFNRRS